MKIVVHTDYCIASGSCVQDAPKVFAQDEAGLVYLLQNEPPGDLHDAVRNAVTSCPAAVIEIVEE